MSYPHRRQARCLCYGCLYEQAEARRRRPVLLLAVAFALGLMLLSWP